MFVGYGCEREEPRVAGLCRKRRGQSISGKGSSLNVLGVHFAGEGHYGQEAEDGKDGFH